MKKAQGLSMNVIIIAAIALLVLVIISVLVLRAGGNVNQGTGCTGVNGVCVQQLGINPLDDCSAQGDYIYSPNHGCSEEGQVCCVPV